jgi:hypothetical protein
MYLRLCDMPRAAYSTGDRLYHMHVERRALLYLITRNAKETRGG